MNLFQGDTAALAALAGDAQNQRLLRLRFPGDRGASKIARKHCLTPEQVAAHPDAAAPPRHRPLAHTADERNLFGLGYAQAWYVRATAATAVPAPRIEKAGEPFTAKQFWKAQRAHAGNAASALPP
ncbi:MAG TPA: hypothetical protein VGP06_14550 [Janthinobacterium sp.]|nr:hypothetical protein [Janthinobacterium sp.]